MFSFLYPRSGFVDNNDKETCIFTWTIQNFCLGEHEYTLQSPSFHINTLHSTKWSLLLYPRGKISSHHMSCYLQREKTGNWAEKVTIDFEISFVSSGGSTAVSRGMEDKPFSEGEFWGYSQYVERELILETQKKTVLPEDILTLRCHIHHDSKRLSTKGNLEPIEEINLSRDFELLYESGKYSDITLLAGKEEYRLHKAVLHARAPLFASELMTQMTCQTEIVTVDIEVPVLKTFLSYLYTGKLDTRSHVRGLYTIAERYQLHDLKWKLCPCPTQYFARSVLRNERKCFTWPVKNFSCLAPNKEVYYPAFCTSTWAYVRFALSLIQPSENIEISVQLIDANRSEELFIKLQISVVSADGSLTHSRKADHYFRSCNSNASDEVREWRFPSFIKKSDLNRDIRLYLPGDILSLSCQLDISDDKTMSWIEKVQLPSSSYSTFTCCSSDLGGLCTDFERLSISGEHSDMCLNSGNRDFPVHKVFLCGRSPVFSKMFEHEMAEKKSGNVSISDIDGNILSLMIRFVYSGRLDKLDYQCALKLYETADRYQLSELQEKCAAMLKSSFAVDNIAEALVIADNHLDEKLKASVIEFIRAHYSEVFLTAGWKNVVAKNSGLAKEVLLQL